MYDQIVASKRKETEESSVHVDRELETSIKYFRGYAIGVRGQIPEDIGELISKLHSAAIRRHGRHQISQVTGPNHNKELGD